MKKKKKKKKMKLNNLGKFMECNPEFAEFRRKLDALCPVDRPQSPLWDLTQDLDRIMVRSQADAEEWQAEQEKYVTTQCLDDLRDALAPFRDLADGKLEDLRSAWVSAIPANRVKVALLGVNSSSLQAIIKAEAEYAADVRLDALSDAADHILDQASSTRSKYSVIDDLVNAVLRDLHEHRCIGVRVQNAIADAEYVIAGGK